ncbi:hypothetical protein [Nonomuraea africana]|uniref:Uncharacterized protein n=1 Tax=Nonomuraea africana TaxID=46171 RepID=A0ABR9KNL9_9ACTN|nr:hypothetical protein [Nonomuraea africana]MBE1563624.1 hypothetical protein [Nonomuraea africana]
MFVHDWRAVPPQAWLEHLNRSPEPDPFGPAAATAERLAVLS